MTILAIRRAGLGWFLLVLVTMAGSVRAEDWPHYLGPGADGSVTDPGIRTNFPKAGFPLAWRNPAGGGYAGPAVANGRVYLFDRLAEPYRPDKIEGNPHFIRAAIPGRERVRALHAETGATLWEHVYGCPYTTVYRYATGPRCTPTVDGDRVYTLGSEGDLHCLRVADGHLLWARDFKDDFGLEIPEWGCAAHPLVHGDQLICVVGGAGSTVVSFDKHTGEERWRALDASKPGYCPPTLATIHGLTQLLIWHGDGVASLDPRDGTRHWSVDIKPKFGMAIGAPRVHEDWVHVMGYKGVSAAFRVAPDNRSAPLIWGPDLRKGVAGVFNTAYLDDQGYLYSADDRGVFRCVDIRTGDRLWETPRPLQSHPNERPGAWPSAFSFHHRPSGKTFLYNDHGEWISAELTPEAYREISRAKVIEPTHEVGGRRLIWSPPAIADGRLYLRNDREIRCYNLAPDAPGQGRHEALWQTQNELVARGHSPSNVLVVARGGRTLYHRAVTSDLEGDRPINPDTLFAIWSMSKPITSVLAMILQERGKFALDDPVSDVLPGLAKFTVQGSDGEPEPLKRPITYRHLLTHTSGIAGYDGSFDQEGTWKEVMKLDDLESLIELLAGNYLEHQPGERFTYGLSTAVLGHALERLSGENLAVLLQREIFDPLGMTDTRFHLTAQDRRDRFQPLFVKTQEGRRPGTPEEDELYYQPGSRLLLGGEGLVSTAGDFSRFCQMLVDRGRAPDGSVVIRESSLENMLRDQLGGVPGFWGSEKGYRFGLGFQVLQEPQKAESGAPAGIYGWGGYHNTTFWIDPENALHALFLSRGYPSEEKVEQRLHEAIYGADADSL